MQHRGVAPVRLRPLANRLTGDYIELMDNPKEEERCIKPSTKECCIKCGQSAWRVYSGKRHCIPCGYRPPTSYGMCVQSVYAKNHPKEVYHD